MRGVCEKKQKNKPNRAYFLLAGENLIKKS